MYLFILLVTEICGPTYRTYFGILTQFPFGIGAALLPLVAYFIREWTSLQLAISIPGVLLGLYYFFVPESPRWLMGEGRIGNKQNGRNIIQDICAQTIIFTFQMRLWSS